MQTTNPDRHPDAVLVPFAYKTGATSLDRVNAVLNIAEPILGVDRSAGERGHLRDQVQPEYNGVFVTKDPADTLRFPVGHPRAGQERYTWRRLDDGIKLGYLLEDPPTDG